jgi:hypothetical protein
VLLSVFGANFGAFPAGETLCRLRSSTFSQFDLAATPVSANLVTCTAPPLTAGPYDFSYVQNGRNVILSELVLVVYPKETAVSVSPAQGFVAGGLRVTVTGTGFLDESRTAQCQFEIPAFGATPARLVASPSEGWLSPSQVVCRTPALAAGPDYAAGSPPTVSVRISNNGVHFSSVAASFAYLEVLLLSASPSEILFSSTTLATVITFTGTNFPGAPVAVSYAFLEPEPQDTTLPCTFVSATQVCSLSSP